MRTEIVCPQTEPETEWVRGRALRKMSPTYRHGLAQLRVAAALAAWVDACKAGRVAMEWRFRITPPGEPTRPLVPDVAYVSYATLPASAGPNAFDVPTVPPTVAIEVLSPGDRADDVRDKIATYLAAGTSVVFIVDPSARNGTLCDGEGVRSLVSGDRIVHAALPGFALELEALFEA